MKNMINLITKHSSLMRRSTVLNLPLQLVFPGCMYATYLLHRYWLVMLHLFCVHAASIYTACILWICDTSSTPMLPSCFDYVACMLHVCWMYAACMLHAQTSISYRYLCCMYAACMSHVCCMYAAWMMRICFRYVVYMLWICCVCFICAAMCLNTACVIKHICVIFHNMRRVVS